MGRPDDGLSSLTESLAAADEHEEPFYEAQIYRLKGELLLRRNNSNAEEAQNCFQRAEITRNQSAKSLELRATTSLARLLAKQGRRGEARTMLAEIYNWFTEGFDTRRPEGGEITAGPTERLTPMPKRNQKTVAKSSLPQRPGTLRTPKKEIDFESSIAARYSLDQRRTLRHNRPRTAVSSSLRRKADLKL
jgi:hypothetical protein